MPKMKKTDAPVQPAAEDFEKLGVFYMGRPYDLVAKQAKPGWLLYDSKDLVTHAVCVGMTGSGKTGLCLALLEEAAIDNIPAIIIDPKGDLGNLMLTFPSLKGEDFRPWINEDDARKKGLAPADYAQAQAELWTKGLAGWQQDGARIQRLRDAAEVVMYTPGSNAGLPVSILKSFSAPSDDVLDDAELLRERISTTVTSVLGLLGIEADPIQSREHILLSTILDQTWRKGQDLDLAALIQAIQAPPVSKIGVMDVDSFFPSKDRFALAMKLNNLLAAPGFQAWLEGEALDIQSIMYTPQGKPRLAIFSIAHLNDAERMFFVTLLLSQMVGWMRAQSGTTSLRALLYMDEIFGYFPPVSNPPSKLPLMTLLKQARAFGLGVVLATQNPVDLDYKGLANTGTWFIGRLQTERDKARVLEGLEGASSSAGKKFDRGRMEQTLAGLGNRIFLMNNVHEDEPVVFETRWCLSYLRGPLTRTQIKALMDPVRGKELGGRGKEMGSAKPSPHTSRLTPHASRPMLPPDVPQHFVPLRGTKPEGSELVYAPMLLGASQIRFSDSKSGIDTTQDMTVLAPMADGPLAVDWDKATAAELVVADLEREPEDGAQFLPLPASAGKAKSYADWNKDFGGWIFRTRKVELFRSPSTKEVSQPGESERDFRVRLQQAGRECRDKGADALRQKYAPKMATLQDRIRRAELQKEKQQAESRSSQMQAAISVGASILGAFMGRKTISATNIGRATTAIRSAGRVMKESKDVGAAEENVAALQQQLADLEAQFKSECDALAAATDPLNEKLETISIKPTKANIAVKLVALAWTPYWRDAKGTLTACWS
ncbi:MAG: ATP-binding protein [Nitrospira sp. HN-bin3]|uniref:ATP-binding protein n=1 Tax=Nitrospira cf. moscoviensis SBR1015 TaxID=96242 RepID=UPI000A0DC4B4|nr:ATP-binding protein [Nitrospira cf. moscoviensis SBR1015]OQW50704.1 MAG: ATP-binding protein [Nitrospira sp. HN-bin3]